jgi:cyanophycinase
MKKHQGKLLLIGGYEDKNTSEPTLRQFISLAGSGEARIRIMTCASTKPEKAGDKYKKVFEDLGVQDVDVVMTEDGRKSNDPKILKSLRDATGIFFIGGEPARITDAIADTPIHALLHEKFSDGCILAGSSAGALVMTDHVIEDGESEHHPTERSVEFGKGLGLLPNVLLDVHFAERGRTGQLLAALAKHPEAIALGLDEDTALLVDNGNCEVLGSGNVYVFDASQKDFMDLSKPKSLCYSLANVRLSVLGEGCRFNLATRQAQS